MAARRGAVERLKARRGFQEENVWKRELAGTRSRQDTPRLPQRHEQGPKAWMTLGILYEGDDDALESTSSTLEEADRAKLVERCQEIAELNKTIADLEGGPDLHPEHSRTTQQNAAKRREAMRSAERVKYAAELESCKQRISSAALALQDLTVRSQETKQQYDSTRKQLQEMLAHCRLKLSEDRSKLEQIVAEHHQRSLVSDVEAEAEDAQIAIMQRRVTMLRNQLDAASANQLVALKPASFSATTTPVFAKPQKQGPLQRWVLLSEAALAKDFEKAMAEFRAELEFESRTAAVESEQMKLASAVQADAAGVNWAETEILRSRAAQLGFEVEDAIAEFLSVAIWGASTRSNQTTPSVFPACSRSPTPLVARPKSVLA